MPIFNSLFVTLFLNHHQVGVTKRIRSNLFEAAFPPHVVPTRSCRKPQHHNSLELCHSIILIRINLHRGIHGSGTSGTEPSTTSATSPTGLAANGTPRTGPPPETGASSTGVSDDGVTGIIGPSNVGFTGIGLSKVGVTGIGLPNVGANGIGLSKVGSKVGVTKIGLSTVGVADVGMSGVGICEIGLPKIKGSRVGVTKIGCITGVTVAGLNGNGLNGRVAISSNGHGGVKIFHGLQSGIQLQYISKASLHRIGSYS